MSDIALRAHLAPVLGDAADGSNVRARWTSGRRPG
jgi:hypothetical protein